MNWKNVLILSWHIVGCINWQLNTQIRKISRKRIHKGDRESDHTYSRARAAPRATLTRAFHERRLVVSSVVWRISFSVPRLIYWYTSKRCPCSTQYPTSSVTFACLRRAIPAKILRKSSSFCTKGDEVSSFFTANTCYTSMGEMRNQHMEW